jgi:hypothetical protein
MRGFEQSRRDDLESLGYVWLYLLRGSLPWQGIPAAGSVEKLSKILDRKVEIPFEQLCDGFPEEFVRYLEGVSRLAFDEEPDYAGYRQMFRELFVREGFEFDYCYDWTVKKSTLSSQPPTPLHSVTQPGSLREPGILHFMKSRPHVVDVRRPVPKSSKQHWVDSGHVMVGRRRR